MYKKLVEMSRNNDYTTENALDCSYHQNHWHRFIKTDEYKYSATN